MTGLLLRGRERTIRDSGVSLVELIVVTAVFLMIIGIITASVVTMMKQTRKETGESDNLDSARKIIQTLDQGARYANEVTTPGTGSDGAFYFEYRTGNSGQAQTCHQWRYSPTTKQVQSRTWQPPIAGSGTPIATGWILEGTGVGLVGSTPIWSIAPASTSDVHETLAVTFTTTHGVPAATQTSQVTLTAINSPSSSPPTNICKEVGRP